MSIVDIESTYEMSPCLVQLGGIEGVGKTTLARNMVQRIKNLATMEKDIYLWGLLIGGIPRTQAGPFAYDQLFAATEIILKHGLGVIVDSPCFNSLTLQNGQFLAAKYGARYLYVECTLSDSNQRATRLSDPHRLPCQAKTLSECQRSSVVRPQEGWITIDLSQPIASCVTELTDVLIQRGLASRRRIGNE